ncbi:MAG: SMP-30/gluconolactonase/LRE family protein [Pseudomonas sp.]
MREPLKTVVSLAMSLGECPLWDHRHRRLHWIDIHAGRIYSWAQDDNVEPHFIELDEPVDSLALSADGLLAATASGLWLLDSDGHKRQLTANPEWLQGAGNRFNDGRCDAQGRFWVGTLDRNETASSAALYCWNGDSLDRHLSGLVISNGLAFSPDGAWMYHADSLRRQVWRYPYDARTGQPGQGEPWIDLDAMGLEGVPDGAAIDSSGRYWCALYGGAQVACFDALGHHLFSIEVPCPHPTMVAFGGTDLRTLYVTTARQHLSPEQAAQWPQAGSLFACQVDVPGLAEPVLGR